MDQELIAASLQLLQWRDLCESSSGGDNALLLGVVRGLQTLSQIPLPSIADAAGNHIPVLARMDTVAPPDWLLKLFLTDGVLTALLDLFVVLDQLLSAKTPDVKIQPETVATLHPLVCHILGNICKLSEEITTQLIRYNDLAALRCVVNAVKSPFEESQRSACACLWAVVLIPNIDICTTLEQLGAVEVLMEATKSSSENVAAECTAVVYNLAKHEGCRKIISKSSGFHRLIELCKLGNATLERRALIAINNCHGELEVKHRDGLWLQPLLFSPHVDVAFHACKAIVEASLKSEAVKLTLSTALRYVSRVIIPKLDVYALHTGVAWTSTQIHHYVEWLKMELPACRALGSVSLWQVHRCTKHPNNILMLQEQYVIDALKQQIQQYPNEAWTKYCVEVLQFLKVEVHLPPQVPSAHFSLPMTATTSFSVAEEVGVPVTQWTADDVNMWVLSKRCKVYAHHFKEAWVDGDLLLKLTDTHLADMGITHSVHRLYILREISLLIDDQPASLDKKEKTGRTSAVARQVARSGSVNSSSATKSHLNLPLKLQRPSNMNKKLRSDLIHSSNEIPDHYDVFISYRRSTGCQLAALLLTHLQLRGFTVFLDVESLGAGHFDDAILSSLHNSKAVVVLLTQGALDRCVNDDDWVRREIALSMKKPGTTVVPVTFQFHWPEPEQLPADIREITRLNAVSFSHEYQEAFMTKLIQFLGEPSNVLDDNDDAFDSD